MYATLIAWGIKIGAALLIIGAIGFAFHEFENVYYVKPAEVRGAATQLAADQKVVADLTRQLGAASKQAADALADGAACAAAAGVQSKAVAHWQQVAADAQARAAKAAAAGATEHAARMTMQATYLAIVHAPPVKDETCQARLDKVDKLLRDDARARQAERSAK